MENRYESFSTGETARISTVRLFGIVLAGLLLATFAASVAFAQQPVPEPCSPAASESLKSEKQLPPSPAPFGGVIKRDARESKPCWAPRIVPPKGAPNVLLIMTDDAGFGVASTFGGVIPTPALDRIARDLHDDIAQQLALLAVEIDQLQHNLPDSPATLRNRMVALRA